MSYPSTYSAWRRTTGPKPNTIERTFDETLPSKLDPYDVVVKIRAVSLNYREHAMLIGTYPVPNIVEHGVPASDASAEVVAVGSEVSRWKAGDRVVPVATQSEMDPENDVGLGSTAQGVLREYAVFHEKTLLRLPDNLSWEEGATLACAGLTAWVALDNLKHVPKGAAALLQGTGGVSLFALALCLSAGIRPIITSSSDDKIAQLCKFHPDIRGLNYKTVKDQEAEIKRLTEGRGVDFVINNTGVKSIPEDISFLAPRHGTISLVGFLAGFDADWEHVKLMGLMNKSAKLKGVAMGSYRDFAEMNKYIEDHKLNFGGLIDRTISYEKATEAFELLASGKFTGKIVIKIDE
ncbi:NAD(P)-binding protein [Plenodomus tracheiphilus IPT5]|uniref:NAD(P)-binding protein n=1 Tax=Plenodomus tracheiphilus IPT5 TaxID=1408161 RepID=A0A6A7AR02_9PLEO|nr:NAD(P)-binding protein [Plenodomus tracheiphilus IPT5]